MEEAVQYAVSPPNDLSHHHIVKGKRSKRMRPSSPLPLFNLASISDPIVMEEEVEGGGGEEGTAIATTDNNNNNNNNNNNDGDIVINEEDEEMANCLILLSKGNPFINNTNNYEDNNEFVKFRSKRYIETPISANGKAGMYVYQCKTCARTFSSFQALGGHRASHKKPKNMAAAAVQAFAFSDDDEIQQASTFMAVKNYKAKKPPALSLELSNWGGNVELPHHLKKIHECSYCGAQFTSGQALGGHMRRHRGGGGGGVVVVPAPVTTPSTNTTLSLSPFPISPASINQQQDSSDIQDDVGKKRKFNELSLDLNLPAPEDHHLHRSNLQLIKQQQIIIS